MSGPAVGKGEIEGPTVFGHPTGLFTLFFAEMWERFSYYGMRALLVFYMIKGFLGYGDGDKAYAVYGAYTALVYMTPFFGGMLADKLLGATRGGARRPADGHAGHLLMTIEHDRVLLALAHADRGNGFFKPNISTIVGTLYPKASKKKDGGFTIFYMGINLGAAMSPICAATSARPTAGTTASASQPSACSPAWRCSWCPPRRPGPDHGRRAGRGSGHAVFLQDTPAAARSVNGFVAIALITAGVIAFTALGRGGLPRLGRSASRSGRPQEEARRRPARRLRGLPRLAGVVRGHRPRGHEEPSSTSTQLICTTGLAGRPGLHRRSAAIHLRCSKIARGQRLFVVLILMFFSMLFWAFFEQIRSSVNNFTDRNVDRVFEA